MSNATPDIRLALALCGGFVAFASSPTSAGPTTSAAAQAGALTGPSNAVQAISEHRRDRIVKRRHANDVEVDAPATYVRSHRGHVIVDAPFANVERSKSGVHVRAPFVKLWIPRR